MKELPTGSNTSIRVHNFWLDGATGAVQAVLVRCVDGKPDEREYFDMPKLQLSEATHDQLLALVLQHAQAADRAAEKARDAEIADAHAENQKTEAENQEAAAKAKAEKAEKPNPKALRALPSKYKRLLSDANVK